jgi:outer membrane protein assembly factor BamB
MYVTDIFGNAVWRFTPGGTAQLWTSVATNPLLVLPDGVKVFNNTAYVSVEGGQILKIPINPDGSAGTASVWASSSDGDLFDDMVLDDRTGDVYVASLNKNRVLQITPNGTITPVATYADGLVTPANMALIHVGQKTVIYVGNLYLPGAFPGSDPSETGGPGPGVFKITIS